MNAIIGLIIIAIGSLGQSSSYVPIKKVKNWSWECFWLIQGIFAWLLFPLLGALIALPSGVSLIDVWSAAGDGMWKAIGFGVLWGIGGLTFGLSMRYLGVALGQSLSLGTCSAFGTLIPAILGGQNLFSGDGLILLIGVSIAIAGIAIIGYAGALKSQNMSEEEKKKAVKDFALKKGILIALLAGVMSACFNLGLEVGAPVKTHLASLGANELLVLNPVILLVTIGGFITNACYCLSHNYKNKTFSDYTTASAATWGNNLMFCALAGLTTLVFSVFRSGDRTKLFRTGQCNDGFLVEYPDVAECYIQQPVGNHPERMERIGTKDNLCSDFRVNCTDYLHYLTADT